MKWPQQQQQQHGQQQLLTTGAAVLPAFLEHKIRRQRQPEEVEATSIRLMNRSNRSDRLSRRRIGSKRIINAKTNALERQRRMRKANEAQQQQHQQQQQQQQQQSGAATGNNSPRNKHAAPAAAPFSQRIPEFLIIALVAPKKRYPRKQQQANSGSQKKTLPNPSPFQSRRVQGDDEDDNDNDNDNVDAAKMTRQGCSCRRCRTATTCQESGTDRRRRWRPATGDRRQQLSPVRQSICPMS
ncbi:hypothetical protein ACLKA7_016638 [Drosophila subpalustris]